MQAKHRASLAVVLYVILGLVSLSHDVYIGWLMINPILFFVAAIALTIFIMVPERK